MKKSLFIFSLMFLLSLHGISAQQQAEENSEVEESAEVEGEEESKRKKKTRGESQDNPEHWPSIKELVADQFNFGIMHNWGVTWGSITRVQKQEDVSNFVWKDRMFGAFYEISSHDFKKYSDFWAINFVGRMAVYYPYRYRFRDVPQNTVQTLLYNFDWFLAPELSYSFFDRVRFDLGVGLHMAYQLHDKFHFFDMGIGAKLDIELPLSSRWTILFGGMFSWDNGNLGTNRRGGIRRYNYVFEYQAQFGMRYSKKYLNKFSYIKYKPKPLKTKKVRKLETLSEDLDLELDIPQEVLDEIEAEANKDKEEPPVVEEPVVEEPPVQQEEVEAEEENAEPKVKEKKQKEKKVKEPKEPKQPKEPKVKEPKPAKEPKVKEPKLPKEPKVKEPKPPKEPKEPKQKEEKQSRAKRDRSLETLGGAELNDVQPEAPAESEAEQESSAAANAIRR